MEQQQQYHFDITNTQQFINQICQLDPQTVLYAVSQKLLGHYSIFDLILQKAKLNVAYGAMESIINDIHLLIDQSKQLINGCLDKDPNENNPSSHQSIFIDDELAATLDLEDGGGWWKLKQLSDVEYRNDILNVEFLFPSNVDINGNKNIESSNNQSLIYENSQQIEFEIELNETNQSQFGIEDYQQNFNTSELEEYLCTFSYTFEKEDNIQCINEFDKQFSDSKILHDKNKYQCSFCSEKFFLLTDKNKHINKFHLKKYKCKTCGEYFGAKDELLEHKLTHIGEKTFKCLYCPYKTYKKFNLEKHTRNKHGEVWEKNFSCDLCVQDFETKGRLVRHFRVVHNAILEL